MTYCLSVPSNCEVADGAVFAASHLCHSGTETSPQSGVCYFTTSSLLLPATFPCFADPIFYESYRYLSHIVGFALVHTAVTHYAFV